MSHCSCGNSLGQSTGVSKLYSFGGDGFLDTKTQGTGGKLLLCICHNV